METEGIFRRSANASTVRECKAAVNRGEFLDFDEHNDVHFAAVLIKTFFRCAAHACPARVDRCRHGFSAIAVAHTCILPHTHAFSL